MREINIVQRILQRLLIFETSHPFFVIGIALGLSMLSVSYTVKNLDFFTSQKALISPRHRLVQLSEHIEQFDNLDNFIVAVENGDPSRSVRFLNDLALYLKRDKDNYLDIFFRVDPEHFRKWALLYLDTKDLQTIKNNLEEHQDFIKNLVESPGLTSLFSGINREMASRMVGELFTGFLKEDSPDSGKDPMDLGFLIDILREMVQWLDGDTTFISPWGKFFAPNSWKDESGEGYFQTKDKKYLLLFVTPKKTGNNFVKARRSLLALRKAVACIRTKYPDIRVGVTGQEALNMDEMGAAMNDMSIATGLSVLGLVTLLVLFWRGIRRPLLEMTELLVALSLTFGLTTLFIGHLNILSVTFAPLLLGLGIDYGIHWFARYQEEEQLHHLSKEEAIQSAMLKLGPGILLAGVTAALSFFPLVLTGFRGLMELGIITSMGMIMTTVTTLCLLPALTLVFDKQKAATAESSSVSDSKGRPLFTFNKKLSLAIIISTSIATGLSLWAGQDVAFDLNMLHLQSRNAESVIWEKKLLDGSDRSSMYGAVIAQSFEEIRQKTTALETLKTVSEVQSVLNMLPEDQKKKIGFLKKMKPVVSQIKPLKDPEDPVSISRLDRILGRISFKMLDSEATKWGADKPLQSQMTQVRNLIYDLRKRLETMKKGDTLNILKRFEYALIQDLNDKFDILHKNVNTSPMELKDLPTPLIKRFVSENRSYLLRVYPTQDIWEPTFLGKFVHDLQSVDPDVIGDPVTLYVFTKAFRDACIKAAMYAVAFIFLVLLITFRSLVYAALVMIPLGAGTIWTVGLMDMFGVDFNLANSIFLPLIVGAGVEYGIIIVQRWRQGGGKNRDMVLPFSTAKGIILAGLTTTVGFGSLTISDHQGIYSLGLLAVIGSLSILVAAIFLLPAVLHFVRQKGSIQI